MIRTFLYILGLFIVLLIVSLIIPSETAPPGDTRVILEHTYETYIAPSCFEQADATNYLEESTFANAKELSYLANDACTEQIFQNEESSFLTNILKKIGIMSTKWEN